MNRDKATPVLMSHLAVYPAMYTLGVYLLVALAIGIPAPGWQTIAFLLLVAHSCYLLDRVKVTDSRQDPADALALPDRALMFSRHSIALRITMLIELLGAGVLGLTINPLLTVIPFGALLGVHIYAGRAATPDRPRLKDLSGLKSFFISTAHIALVITVLWGNDHDAIMHPRPMIVASMIGTWMIVSADAILCDLDDVESDAMYDTRSLPVLFGPSRAWILAMSFMICGVLCLFVWRPYTPSLAIASIILLISAAPTMKTKNRRDLIDARLLPAVLIGLMLG